MKKNVDNFNIVNSIILFVLIIMSIIVLKFASSKRKTNN